MAHLIRTPAAYRNFFRWKNHYTYHRPKNICGLCAALNNQAMLEARSIMEFRRWWNPDFLERCKDGLNWGTQELHLLHPSRGPVLAYSESIPEGSGINENTLEYKILLFKQFQGEFLPIMINYQIFDIFFFRDLYLIIFCLKTKARDFTVDPQAIKYNFVIMIKAPIILNSSKKKIFSVNFAVLRSKLTCHKTIVGTNNFNEQMSLQTLESRVQIHLHKENFQYSPYVNTYRPRFLSYFAED